MLQCFPRLRDNLNNRSFFLHFQKGNCCIIAVHSAIRPVRERKLSVQDNGSSGTCGAAESPTSDSVAFIVTSTDHIGACLSLTRQLQEENNICLAFSSVSSLLCKTFSIGFFQISVSFLSKSLLGFKNTLPQNWQSECKRKEKS